MSLKYFSILLVVYLIIGLIFDWSLARFKTFWTQKIIAPLRTHFLDRDSEKGAILVQGLVEMKANKFIGSKVCFPEYLTFHLFLQDYFDRLRSMGKIDHQVLDYFIDYLRTDVKFQKGIEQVSNRGYIQLFMISSLISLFLLYTYKVLELQSTSANFLIIWICCGFALVSYALIKKFLYRWLFSQVDSLLQIIIKLRGYSQLRIPIKQVIVLSNLDDLYLMKWRKKELESCFSRLIENIERWKTDGADISQSLDLLMELILSHRENYQAAFLSSTQLLMFFLTLMFGLLPFFYSVFRVLSQYYTL